MGTADPQQGSAQAQAAAPQRRQGSDFLKSLPEVVAVPAQHKHPQHTAPSDLTRKICPYLSNAAVFATKTLMEDSIDLHGILQLVTKTLPGGLCQTDHLKISKFY